MIRACEAGTLPLRAGQLLDGMMRQGLLPDGITYTALISAGGKGTPPQRALQRVEAMLHHGLLPDGITYSALVGACGKGTQPQRVLNSLRPCGTKASRQTGSFRRLGQCFAKGENP